MSIAGILKWDLKMIVVKREELHIAVLFRTSDTNGPQKCIVNALRVCG